LTLKEKHDEADTWQEKVLTINFYHCLMVAKKPKWGMRETAQYFQISLGQVSESILLAINIELVKHHDLRKDAMAVVKALNNE
jgi:hypothetical protein